MVRSRYDLNPEPSAATKVAKGLLSSNWVRGVIALFVIFLIASMTGCLGKTVPPGYVGVRTINQAFPGFTPGVQPNELGVGWHPPIPNSKVDLFPVTTSTLVWAEGDAAENIDTGSRQRTTIAGPAMRFVVSDRIRVGLPIAIQVSTIGPRASDLVEEYRFGFDELVNGPVQRALQNAFTRAGPRYTSDQIINDGGTSLAAAVEEELRTELHELGVNLRGMQVVGPPILPQDIQERITALVEARQNTLLQQERVQVVEAEAQQRIAEAHGRAEAIRIEGQALRESPQVARLREIERWNGQCPLDTDICAPGNAAAVQGNRN